MIEILAVMCERCAGDELNGKRHDLFWHFTSQELAFWGCPHLNIVCVDESRLGS